MRTRRGALIEYGSDFLGPIPNVVIFQFNPETLTRNIEIPPRPSGTGSRETSQAGELPVEKISLTAHFSAADQLGANDPLARLFGVGHRLAALEKMVRPAVGTWTARIIDSIGEAIAGGGQDKQEKEDTQPIPRESYPKLLFVWGRTRVLPVVVDSMSITEQEYDADLNPVRAEVSIGLSVMTPSACAEDKVASGALDYSNLAKDAQAAANLAGSIAQSLRPVRDLIPF